MKSLIDQIKLTNNANAIELVKSPYYLWHDYRINVSGVIITNNLLNTLITSFYRDVIVQANRINEVNSYAIILKFEFTDGTVRSISNVHIINIKSNINELIDLFIGYWTLRTEYYHQKEVKYVNLSFRLLDNKSSKNIISIKNFSDKSDIEPKKESVEYKYDGYLLPDNTDILTWGRMMDPDSNHSMFIESKIKHIYYNIFKYSDHHFIQVFINKTLIMSVKDIFINGNIDPYHFKRVIKNNEFIYKKGQIVEKKIFKKLQYIRPISKSLYRSFRFITLDIETKNLNGFLRPICISIYDGNSRFSFFRDDFKTEYEMILAAFNILNKRKYHYQRVYIHNLSYFDGVFLLKYLGKFGDVKPLIKNGKIYNIKLTFNNSINNNNKNYVIYIRDSLLILPLSLYKLGSYFKVNNLKTIFPIDCLNDLPLNYIGPIPDKKYFKNESDYRKYVLDYSQTQNWNLKKELIKYCENDVISLHQIINRFSLEIFKLYRIDINKCMTLSSISFSIFRSNFLTQLTIPKITGELYKDIYKSYRGGIVDMYIPQGYNLFLQDVNSEYPDVMRNDMPGGNVYYVEGNIDLNKKSNFGFFKAEVEANNNLNIPILPVKFKNVTMCPLGKWTGWYFSEELKEAQNKYGYKIKVLKGYIFERINVFEGFVNSLYSIKENTPKKEPLYLITKLLLNMLYGRMAMGVEIEENLILPYDETEKYYVNPNISVTDVIDLGFGKELIKFLKKTPNLDLEKDSPNISISIASAIVAYGRIKINSLKHLSGILVYYSDTDSLVTNKPLPDYLLGSKLGQLKIEENIKSGLFLAPKVYGYINPELKSKVKIKGLKSPFDYFELYPVLYKNTTLSKSQSKWYRLWNEGTISIKDELYSLNLTYHKRQLVFDSSNKLVGTRPYIINQGEIINFSFDYVYNISEPDFKNKLITAPTITYK